jgi:hypothetical protein
MATASHENVRVVSLGRSRSRPLAGAGAAATRVIVRKNGEIRKDEAPQKLSGHRGDILIWICENRSGVPIKVAVTDFKFRIIDKPVSPVAWGESGSISLAKDETKLIQATITRKARLPVEFVKYNVRVTGAFGTVDHDPDLEIKP